MTLFHKMHGLGNDYIYIEGFSQCVDIERIASKTKDYCHRRKSIGADGIIFILPNEEYDAEMRIFNRDGSEAQMCGNGARCCIRLLSRLNLVQKKTGISLKTKSGILYGDIDKDQVKMKMYQMPHIESDIKVMEVKDRNFNYYIGNIGNPHVIISTREVRDMNVEYYGKPIENNTSLFPEKTNVEFFEEIREGRVFMRVWERGSGETMACGTGAACVAGVYRLLKGKKIDQVEVELLGGMLTFLWEKENFFMMGETTYVFESKLPILFD